jgi:hypothetical protein
MQLLTVIVHDTLGKELRLDELFTSEEVEKLKGAILAIINKRNTIH